MDEFDLGTGIITGKKVSSGSDDITAEDLIPGKVGQPFIMEAEYIHLSNYQNVSAVSTIVMIK